jgi:hypothetical protein
VRRLIRLSFNVEGQSDLPVVCSIWDALTVAESLIAAGWELEALADLPAPLAATIESAPGAAWTDLAELRAFLDIWDPVES